MSVEGEVGRIDRIVGEVPGAEDLGAEMTDERPPSGWP
jgi:hypothetical protein